MTICKNFYAEQLTKNFCLIAFNLRFYYQKVSSHEGLFPHRDTATYTCDLFGFEPGSGGEVGGVWCPSKTGRYI